MTELLVGIASEIATKARRTRRRFQDRLVRNIRDCLRTAGIEHRIDARWSRLHISAEDATAARRVADVFGVHSVAVVEARFPADLAEIVRVGEALFRDRVRGKRFAVEARRAGTLPFSTQDVRVQLGAALNEDADVDLTHPDVTVTVEMRDGEAFLFADRLRGVGGLPLGVEGRAACLISGGFDSAVAAWLLLKRGVALDYVFCNLAGEAYERSVVSVAKVLAEAWSFGDRPRIHVIDFTAPVESLKATVTPRYWQIVLKRMMYRAAEQVAQDIRAEAIVTGEAMGQVSSQTLHNLRAIDDAAVLPVLRPLIGADKTDIIRRAEVIGTATLSAHVKEYCAILPDRPATKASTDAARAEESRVDLRVLTRAVAERRVLDLRALRPVDLVQPYLFTEHVRHDAVVIDCREAHHFAAWHYPEAQRRDISELVGGFRELDKDRTYVLYCSIGVLSAHVAEVMQRAGYEAYSFKGGAGALRRHAEQREVAAPL